MLITTNNMLQPSQQNTPLDPRKQDTPLDNNSQETPLNPGANQEPVSTPLKQQPLESQGLSAGQIPSMPGEEMASPEQREQLMELLEATREAMGQIQTTKFRSENEKEAMKVDTLKQIFQSMQSAGVDLNDPASVATFLDKLEATNPTMSQYFKESLDELMGAEAPVGEQQMGQAAPSFDEAAPQEGPKPPMDLKPPMFDAAAAQGAPEGMTPPTNEALPEDLRGPVPGAGPGQPQ